MSGRLVALLGVIVAAACAERPTFTPDQARAALEAFLGAADAAGRLALCARPVREALAESPPEGPFATLVPGSLALREQTRDHRRARFACTWRERMGVDERSARGSFGLVQEQDAPRVLWLDPLIERAWALALAGKVRPARNQLEDLLDLDPGAARVHDRLGWLALRGGQLHDAEAAFTRAAELDPAGAAPLASLGALRERQGRLDEAAELTRRSLEREPTVTGWANLGNLLARLGRAAEAGHALEEALRLEPDHPGTLLFWAEHLRDTGDYLRCAEAGRHAWNARDKLEPFARVRLTGVRAACAFATGAEREGRDLRQALRADARGSVTAKDLEAFLDRLGVPPERRDPVRPGPLGDQAPPAGS